MLIIVVAVVFICLLLIRLSGLKALHMLDLECQCAKILRHGVCVNKQNPQNISVPFGDGICIKEYINKKLTNQMSEELVSRYGIFLSDAVYQSYDEISVGAEILYTMTVNEADKRKELIKKQMNGYSIVLLVFGLFAILQII